jgi:hypothetical protein
LTVTVAADAAAPATSNTPGTVRCEYWFSAFAVYVAVLLLCVAVERLPTGSNA